MRNGEKMRNEPKRRNKLKDKDLKKRKVGDGEAKVT